MVLVRPRNLKSCRFFQSCALSSIHRRMMLLRGRSEHASLTWGNIKFGTYGEDSKFPVGTPYVQIVNLVDKTHKVALGKSHDQDPCFETFMARSHLYKCFTGATETVS